MHTYKTLSMSTNRGGLSPRARLCNYIHVARYKCRFKKKKKIRGLTQQLLPGTSGVRTSQAYINHWFNTSDASRSCSFHMLRQSVYYHGPRKEISSAHHHRNRCKQVRRFLGSCLLSGPPLTSFAQRRWLRYLSPSPLQPRTRQPR